MMARDDFNKFWSKLNNDFTTRQGIECLQVFVGASGKPKGKGKAVDSGEAALIESFMNPPKENVGSRSTDEMVREPELPRIRNQQFQVDYRYERGLLKCRVGTRVTDVSFMGMGGPEVTDIGRQTKEGTLRRRSDMERVYLTSTNTHCNAVCSRLAREAIAYAESARGLRVVRAKLEIVIDPETDVAYLVGASNIHTKVPLFNTGPMLLPDAEAPQSNFEDGPEIMAPPSVLFNQTCQGDFCETTQVRRLRKEIEALERSGEDVSGLTRKRDDVSGLLSPVCEVAYRSVLSARLEQMAKCNYFAPVWALLEEGCSELVPLCNEPKGPLIDPVKLQLKKDREMGRIPREAKENETEEQTFFTGYQVETPNNESTDSPSRYNNTSPSDMPIEHHDTAHGRPHLKVVPALLATGDLGAGMNGIDFYRPVGVCEACSNKYADIDRFREKVHAILMEDIQRENDRRAKEDEAQARCDRMSPNPNPNPNPNPKPNPIDRRDTTERNPHDTACSMRGVTSDWDIQDHAPRRS